MALAGSVVDTLNACTSCAAAGNGVATARRDASRSALIESVTRSPPVAMVPPFCAWTRLLLRLRYTYRRPHTGEMNERGFPPNRELIQTLGGSWLEPDDVAIANRPRLERFGRGRRKSVQIGRAEDAYDRFFGQGRVIDHDLPPVVAIDLRDRRLQGFPIEGHQALAPGEPPVRLAANQPNVALALAELHRHFGRGVQHQGRTILESDAPDLADTAGVVFSTPTQDDPGQATRDDGDRRHAGGEQLATRNARSYFDCRCLRARGSMDRSESVEVHPVCARADVRAAMPRIGVEPGIQPP